jgi:hypothetical protein
MKLFIANMTQQQHDFIYRVPGSPRIHRQHIPAGGQVQVHQNDLSAVLEGIVQQHERYGLKPASEVLQRRGFTGLCYSYDTPINVDTFMVAQQQNDTALTDQGLDRRQNEAAAIHERMGAPEAGELQRLELEVVEVPKQLGGDVNLNETIAVGDPSRTEQRSSMGRRGRR